MYTLSMFETLATMIPALKEIKFEAMANDRQLTHLINDAISNILPNDVTIHASHYALLENLEELENGTGYFDGIVDRDLTKTAPKDTNFFRTIHVGLDKSNRLVLAFSLGELGAGCIFQRFCRGERGIWVASLPKSVDMLTDNVPTDTQIDGLLSGRYDMAFTQAVNVTKQKQTLANIKLLKGLGHHDAVWALRMDSLLDCPEAIPTATDPSPFGVPNDSIVINARFRFKTLMEEAEAAGLADTVFGLRTTKGCVVENGEVVALSPELLAQANKAKIIIIHSDVANDFPTHKNERLVLEAFRGRQLFKLPRQPFAG